MKLDYSGGEKRGIPATVPASKRSQEEEIMKKAIATDRAPSAIGPYSQAVSWENLLFVSGQIALDPESGSVKGDIKEQTRTVLTNLGRILEAGGSSLDCVVKTTVFLADIADFAAMNEVYGSFFTDSPPARSAFQVANLPKGAAVEIEAIACMR
jgi:2-iminobutanoate/2-iminopropanoate deaminase